MRVKCASIAGLLLFLLSSFGGAIGQSSASPAEPKISELDWMVGDWQAVDKSDASDPLTIHLTARRSENQQAIVFQVSTESKGQVTPKYDGMYYWDPAEKSYKIFQVSNDGNVAHGTFQQTGNRITQLVKTVTLDGKSFELKSDWEVRPREFHFVAQFRPTGKTEWWPAMDLTYSRVGAGALPPPSSTSRHHH